MSVAGRIIGILASLIVAPATASAQLTRGAEVIGGPVVPYVFDGDLRDLPLAPPPEPGAPTSLHEKVTRPPLWIAPAPRPPWIARRDPLAELQRRVRPAAPASLSAPIVNVAGIGFTGWAPPDTVGAVGPNHYIQAVNDASSVFSVYSKSGAALAGPLTMESLAPTGSTCHTQGAGDPMVLYDRMADRFFLLEFTSGGDLCSYVSRTPDPISGGWYFYQYNPPQFPDYPHFSVWPDAYYGTTNESSPAIYALDRANMLIGAVARPMQRFTVTPLAGYGFQALTPASLSGSTLPSAGAPCVFVRHDDDEAHVASPDPAIDYIDMFTLSVDWNTPANSTLATLPKITITDFNSWLVDYSTFSSIPQSGTTTRVDSLREIVMHQLQYRNWGTYETLTGNFVTNVNPAVVGSTVDAGVRWFVLVSILGGPWALYQEGTYTPDDTSTHHWLGGISMDQAGNIALGTSLSKTSGPTNFPSMRYTGRLATDALGVMTQGDKPVADGTTFQSGNRWGDYAAESVDPADDCTFWFTSEYVTGSWATRIASYKFSECPCAAATAAPVAPAVAQACTVATVNWPAVPGAVYYNVFRRQGSCGGSFTQVGTGILGTTFSDTGLSPNTQYSWYVVAVGPCGTSADGGCTTLTTGTPPSAPTGLTAGPGCPGTALSWNAVALATSYEIDRVAGASCGATFLATTAGTTYSDTTGTPGTIYSYQVKAINAAGCASVASNCATSMTNGTQVVFSDDFEAGGGNWTLPTGAGSARIQIVATPPGSGTQVMRADNNNKTNKCVVATLNVPVSIAAGANSARLQLWSQASLIASDAGRIEISANGGATWSALTTIAYTATAPSTYTCTAPAFNAGEGAWSGTAAAAVYSADLSTYRGQTLRFRVRFATGATTSGSSFWYIDDFTVRQSFGVAPARVGNTVMVVKSGADALLSWGAVSGATGYNVYATPDSTANVWPPTAPSVPAGWTQLNDAEIGATTFTHPNGVGSAGRLDYKVTPVSCAGEQFGQ